MQSVRLDLQGRWSALTTGLALIGVGSVFLLANLDVLNPWSVWRFGPWLLLLGLGALRVLAPRPWPYAKGGLAMALIGAWGLATTVKLGGLGWGTSWPLLLIGFGCLALVEALWVRPGSKRDPEVES